MDFFLGYSDISNEAYNVQALSRYLDMANIYAYDYHGYWDQVTGHHSAIDQSQGTYYAKYAMDYYTKNGFAKSQLNLGIPFYGQSYTLESAGNANVGAPATGPGAPGKFSNQQGMLTFFEICQKGKEFTYFKIWSISLVNTWRLGS